MLAALIFPAPAHRASSGNPCPSGRAEGRLQPQQGGLGDLWRGGQDVLGGL